MCGKLSWTQEQLLLMSLVAYPLLAGIEAKVMADYGCDWLRHPHAARLAIVVSSRNVNGLKMFDPRMAWQVTSSLLIVCGSVDGAFILSRKRVFLIWPPHSSQSGG